MSFIGFLQGVPAPAWGLAGAIVGVLGTLVATKISNNSNDRRFENQLKHDAEQKSKDRAAQLRRSVYLKAVAELVGINAFLGQLAAADPTDTNSITKGATGFFKAMGRVSLVASERTREKVTDLSGAYGELFMELMADASVAHQLKIDINLNRQIYENLNMERIRIISAMREVNESNDTKYKFESLSNSFESTIQPIGEISEEFKELSNRHQDSLASYGTSATKKISRLSNLHAEVSVLLREELDLDTDIERMKSQLREQASKMAKTLEMYYARLREAWGGGSAPDD